MSKIEMNARDFEIKTIETGKYTGVKIVQLKPSVAFDEDFIQEMQAYGVKEFVKKETEE